MPVQSFDESVVACNVFAPRGQTYTVPIPPHVSARMPGPALVQHTAEDGTQILLHIKQEESAQEQAQSVQETVRRVLR